MLAEIRPDKKYPRVSLSLSCSDGAMVFIQLNRNEGLRMYSAPDAYYLPVRRVK
ncbi:hypothetical protein [Kingella potus]|uniref:hypothetical protein n=1 Tax=Kingella potus TaxID=265175 RepID=UPI001FD5401D|nr:hypothetical protein [Kingella potus]UOP00014.1 hypothetical protein LVJ84_08330 [Kingella potus]